MKRIITGILLICMVFTTGCGVVKNKTDNEETKMSILEQTTKIMITDLCEAMYEPALEIEMTAGECSEFMELLAVSEKKDGPADGFLLYALELYDNSGVISERIIVDTFNTVETESLGNYARRGELSEFLKRIEEKYGLDDSLWKRKPGDNYFGLLNLATYGTCEELTENNFIQGTEYYITADDIESINGVAKEVTFSEKAIENINKKCIINIFSASGAELYSLFADDNQNIYTDEGYRLSGDSFIKTIIGLMNKMR